MLTLSNIDIFLEVFVVLCLEVLVSSTAPGPSSDLEHWSVDAAIIRQRCRVFYIDEYVERTSNGALLNRRIASNRQWQWQPQLANTNLQL